MKFEYHKGGSNDNRDTHLSKYYIDSFNYCLKLLKEKNIEGVIIDPFARLCKWGDITNDINPAYKTDYNLDCVDFLNRMRSNISKLVLFDPPFSSRQCEEKYQNADVNLYTTDKISKCQKHIERILVPGGLVLKLGYNSNFTNRKNFDLICIKLVSFGGNRNDVIVSIWRKNTHTLNEFIQ